MSVCDRWVHRYARWIGRLSHQSSNLSCSHNMLQKVVICALLDTRFKGIQIVTYLINCQTTEVRLTKSSQEGSGYMHMDKQNTQFFLVILYSTRGTNIARVEGQWLLNRPNHSVPETQMTAPRVCMCSPYILPPKEHERSLWCHFMTSHNHLLYFFGGKTMAHVQRRCHSLSVHLPASPPESSVTITTPKP